MLKYRAIAAAFVLLPLIACSEPAATFSQYPGFRAWYAAHPPGDDLPGAADRLLLQHYRPRLFIPAGIEGPISFYDDYIAQGFLARADGRLVSGRVTRPLLNGHRNDPDVVFTHRPSGAKATPVMLGRVDRETVDLPGSGPIAFTFLTYNVVFRGSGLPAGMPGWMGPAVGLVGDIEDWHQLDHYTAVTVALADGASDNPEPVAATLQQHNYQRTYLLGVAERPGRLALPGDGRLAVDVATASNELYPHRLGRQMRRAVPFMTPDAARYLVMGDDRPWVSADDMTEPAREVDVLLRFLPPSDAFYVFQGRLGERRRLPGRDGPPGADYNTLPAFKAKATQMLLAYWHEDDAGYLEALGGVFRDGRPTTVDLRPFARRFVRDWKR